MEKNYLRITLATVGAMLAVAPALTGCAYVATTTDMCAYTQGDGSGGRDASIHEVFYPGQKAEKSNYELIFYFPCNQRNIRLMDGTTDVNAKGEPVGPVTSRTLDKIEVRTAVRMDWTLNQTKDILKGVFFPLCNKYSCATDNDKLRNANFSTDGWSMGFLGENATPAFQKAVRDTLAQFTYTQAQDPRVQNDELNKAISAAFMSNMRATTGSTKDLMCSSGETSGWSNPATPGQGTYQCGPVRITVDSILATDPQITQLEQEKTKAEQAKDVNQKLLEAAKAKYGDKAEEILGQIDIAKAACEGDKNCTVIVGDRFPVK